MAASDPDDENIDVASFLPFSVQSEARRLTMDEAMAENIFREPGQLDMQWGNGEKYGWRRNSRRNCVKIVGQDDGDTWGQG